MDYISVIGAHLEDMKSRQKALRRAADEATMKADLLFWEIDALESLYDKLTQPQQAK